MNLIQIFVISGMVFTSFANASVDHPVVTGDTVIVCKKRHRMVYSAFYRAELVTDAHGETKFEYGIGDEDHTYELYYSAAVKKVSERSYQSADGVDPRTWVEIKTKRNKATLSFRLTGSDGKSAERGGYICE